MRRVREMQSGNIPQRQQNQHGKPQEKPPENIQQEQPAKSPDNTDPLAGLFKDKEKLLILLLIMLLSQESSNTELVLALLYIII